MNSKKLITLLVLTTMVLSLVPIVSVSAAVEITGLELEGVPILPGDPVQYGDEITVIGGGVTSGATINVYWDIVQETYVPGAGKVASGKAKADGSFSIKFKVPEAAAGPHYIWIKDASTGATYGGAGSNGWVTVIPKLKATPSSGLKGDKIELKGYGYGYNDVDEKGLEVTITFNDTGIAGVPLAADPTTKPKTNALGTWTYTFTITADAYADDYPIETEDEDFNADAMTFKVGASITLSIKEGPVGSVVTITGRGFESGEAVTVSIDGTLCYIVSGGTVRSDGRITTKIVVPSVAIDDYDITVEDEVGGAMIQNAAPAGFTVNGAAKVKATPSYGPQGSQIVVEGWNFTRISGTEVGVTLGGEGAKTYKTDASGYFKGTFGIPAIASGDQDLVAMVAGHSITAQSTVRVGTMLTILTPDSGPSGKFLSVTGVGFTEGEAYTVYIEDDEWFTGTVNTGGTISANEQIPTLEPGVYDITIVDEDTEIEVISTFTVTEKTKVVLTPDQAPNEYWVKVEGWYFAENPTDATLEFILYNATQEWYLDAQYNGLTVVLEADSDWDAGYFEAKFQVPDDESISLGTYTLNVTDGEGLFAQATFSVVEKTQKIDPRKLTFNIGDTVSFVVRTSFVIPDAYIKIYEPSGELYWETDPFTQVNPNVWLVVGTENHVPYYYQTAGGNPMALLADAPLGTWTWEFYDGSDDLIDEGVFNVAAAPSDILAERVEDLNQGMQDLSQEVSTVKDAVAGVQSDVNDAKTAANAAVEAANAAVEAVNTVSGTASQAAQAAQAAADAAENAQKAASGLTTLVYGAIGASLVAALAAIVSLMQISRRIAG